jgi:hypothetical protein
MFEEPCCLVFLFSISSWSKGAENRRQILTDFESTGGHYFQEMLKL